MTGVANEDVQQHVHIMQSEAEKDSWVSANLLAFIDEGECKVLEALMEAVWGVG